MQFRKTLVISVILLSGCGTLSACSQIGHNNSHSRHIKTEHKTNIHRIRETKPIDIYRPSEHKPYPRKLTAKNDQIIVSIPKQRVYIQHHNKTIYTMFASTGSHNRTPRGIFHIQKERGKYFYSSKEHEGAEYYTSWKGHGIYLFHATPNNRKKQIIKPVAKQLGKRPSSHGCVHLTLPDAKYLETYAPVGLKVIIR